MPTRSSPRATSQVEDAAGVIAAFETARRRGAASSTVDGRMIENLHVDTAAEVLATAEAIAALS